MKKTKEEMLLIFSTNLNRIMNEMNLKQVDIAKIAGVSTASVNYWSQGIYIPRMNKIQTIATALNIPVTDLIEEQQKYKTISNNHLKYILFGDDSVSDDKLKQVLKYAEFIKGE